MRKHSPRTFDPPPSSGRQDAAAKIILAAACKSGGCFPIADGKPHMTHLLNSRAHTDAEENSKDSKNMADDGTRLAWRKIMTDKQLWTGATEAMQAITRFYRQAMTQAM